MRKWIAIPSTSRYVGRIIAGPSGVLPIRCTTCSSRLRQMRLLRFWRVSSGGSFSVARATIRLERRCSTVQERIIPNHRPAVIVHPAHGLSEAQLKKKHKQTERINHSICTMNACICISQLLANTYRFVDSRADGRMIIAGGPKIELLYFRLEIGCSSAYSAFSSCCCTCS